MSWQVLQGNCIEVMAEMEEASVDAVVCDPPYGIGFMGREWDSFSPARVAHHAEAVRRKSTEKASEQYQNRFGKSQGGGVPIKYDESLFANRRFQVWCEEWGRECLRVLKPGGHLLASCGSRTYQRLACGIEDAGFEIRDSIMWLQGAGFPKSRNLDRLRGKQFCGCEAEPSSKHDLCDVPGPDVSATEATSGREGPVLLEGVPQPGAPESRPPTGDGDGGEQKSSLERRGDLLAEGGELPRDQVREGAGVGAADGSQGRVHHGAPAADGGTDPAAADEDRSGTPLGPRSDEQRAGEPGVVADQRLSQDGRGWPNCDGCGLPVVPRGLGTALKPAHEPIVVARKPFKGTVASNVLEHGTGAINVDACRVGTEEVLGRTNHTTSRFIDSANGSRDAHDRTVTLKNSEGKGRWPANVVLSHSSRCEPVGSRVLKGDQRDTGNGKRAGGFADVGAESGDGEPNAAVYGAETITEWSCAPGCPVAELDVQSGVLQSVSRAEGVRNGMGFHGASGDGGPAIVGSSGGASRFFYCAKTSRVERNAGLGGRSCDCQTTSPKRDTCAAGEKVAHDSSTTGPGKSTMDRSQTDTKSITATKTSSTTGSRTSNWSAQSTTSGSIPSTTDEPTTEAGSEIAPSVGSGRPQAKSTSTPTSGAGFSTADADPATSRLSSKPSSSVGSGNSCCPDCGGVIGGALRNAHPT